MTIYGHFNKITSLKLISASASRWHTHKSSSRTYTKWTQQQWPTQIFTSTSNTMTGLITRNPYRRQLQILFRFYSDSGDRKNENPPQLMETPLLYMPSVINSIKNWILVTFIIKPYLDEEFCMEEFKSGSRQALEVVSNRLATGDFESLNRLVESDTLATLQRNIERMSVAQRKAIAFKRNDVWWSFPYEVGIIFNDDEEDEAQAHKRFVEITMVFYTITDKAAMRELLNRMSLIEFR